MDPATGGNTRTSMSLSGLRWFSMTCFTSAQSSPPLPAPSAGTASDVGFGDRHDEHPAEFDLAASACLGVSAEVVGNSRLN
jgi:hypothetical protein